MENQGHAANLGTLELNMGGTSQVDKVFIALIQRGIVKVLGHPEYLQALTDEMRLEKSLQGGHGGVPTPDTSTIKHQYTE